jgi:hypothetical protein
MKYEDWIQYEKERLAKKNENRLTVIHRTENQFPIELPHSRRLIIKMANLKSQLNL